MEDRDHQGFHEQGTLQVAPSEPGAKILDITTREDYKVTNSVFDKRKIRCAYAGGRSSLQFRNLYAPVLGL